MYGPPVFFRGFEQLSETTGDGKRTKSGKTYLE